MPKLYLDRFAEFKNGIKVEFGAKMRIFIGTMKCADGHRSWARHSNLSYNKFGKLKASNGQMWTYDTSKCWKFNFRSPRAIKKGGLA